MTFDEIFPLLLKHEGGYVNDPNDRGGETNYGISKRQYPYLNIGKLTKADAYGIYFRDYWLKSDIAILPESIRYSVFDMAVNCGSKAAIKTLQKLCNVKADGVIGPVTIAASRSVPPLDFARARCRYYADIVEDMPSQRKYLKNWLSRTFDVLKAGA